MVANNNRLNLHANDLVDNAAVEAFDETQVFEWEAPEFIYHEKGKNWVWGLVLATIVFVVIFILLKNYLGIGITILLAIVIYQYAFKQPGPMHYVVTRDGLLVGEKLYGFSDLESFWISAEGILYVGTKHYIPPRLSIILISVDIEALEKFLAHYLPKVSREGGDSADNLSRWLRL
ncbi:MAG: hypothetical protein WC570_01565 [Patescibacteria group bacterium]